MTSGPPKSPSQILIRLLIIFLTHRQLLFITGLLTTLIGYFLTPIIVGLPLLLIGWFITTLSVWQKWLNYVPASTRQSLLNQLKLQYRPYTPALNSLSEQITQMIKTASLIFLFLCLGFVLITLKLGFL